MRYRELTQILAIIFCFTLYIIGTSYLNNNSSMNTANVSLNNWGLLIPVSAVGFVLIAWTIAKNVTNKTMLRVDRIISTVIFILLHLFSFAIITDYFRSALFSDPMFLPSLGVFVLIISAILINTRK